MAQDLEVSFNSPQCGWMSIGFSDGAGEFHTTTSHAPYAAALPELMQILTLLNDPDTPGNEYLLRWNRDPEEFDFRFVREGSRLLIEIFQYPNDEREESERVKVFQHLGSIADVTNAFAATFEQLYKDRNTDEFEFHWRQAFPLREYEAFCQSTGRSIDRSTPAY
jgi:hypothetical protein